MYYSSRLRENFCKEPGPIFKNRKTILYNALPKSNVIVSVACKGWDYPKKFTLSGI